MTRAIRRLVGLQPAKPVRRPVVEDTAVDIPPVRIRRREPTDPTQAEMDRLQGLCSWWLVMWCWYRREFAAIARFGDKPTIIYDRDPQQLVFQCRAAELAVPIP